MSDQGKIMKGLLLKEGEKLARDRKKCQDSPRPLPNDKGSMGEMWENNSVGPARDFTARRMLTRIKNPNAENV